MRMRLDEIDQSRIAAGMQNKQLVSREVNGFKFSFISARSSSVSEIADYSFRRELKTSDKINRDVVAGRMRYFYNTKTETHNVTLSEVGIYNSNGNFIWAINFDNHSDTLKMHNKSLPLLLRHVFNVVHETVRGYS